MQEQERRLAAEEIAAQAGDDRDMPAIGHHGAGDMEPTVRSLDDLNKAKPLTRKSFEEN